MKIKGIGKRGLSKGVIIGFVLLLIVIGLWYWGNNCTISEEQIQSSKSSFFSSVWLNFEKFLGCDVEREGFVGTIMGTVGNILGFQEGFADFIPDLLEGLLVGAWMFGAYWLIRLSTNLAFTKYFGKFRLQGDADRRKLESGWLNFVAGRIWKIVPIAIAYAVILQIPILNRLIQIVTFEVLGVNFFFRSIIIAFYIGFVPGAIEAYTRYRLVRHYNVLILKAKYRGKVIDAFSGGG